jgi:hypothetical protein
MLELRAVKKISNDARIFGNGNFDCIFNCPHRGQGMGVSSDPAGTLDKMMGILRITTL